MRRAGQRPDRRSPGHGPEDPDGAPVSLWAKAPRPASDPDPERWDDPRAPMRARHGFLRRAPLRVPGGAAGRPGPCFRRLRVGLVPASGSAPGRSSLIREWDAHPASGEVPSVNPAENGAESRDRGGTASPCLGGEVRRPKSPMWGEVMKKRFVPVEAPLLAPQFERAWRATPAIETSTCPRCHNDASFLIWRAGAWLCSVCVAATQTSREGADNLGA